MLYFVTIGEQTLEVDLRGATPMIDGEPIEAELAGTRGSPTRHLLAAHHSVPLLAQNGDRPGRWRLTLRGQPIEVDAVDERTRAIREMAGPVDDFADRTIAAPMPGLVVRIEVAVGDEVRAGQGVVVVEAMKMENELKAPAEGTVAEIHAAPGDTVEKGTVLIVLE